jgi:hypothetical protein
MTEFFLKTDATVVGPLSGIELREAALAGLLFPDSLIAGSRSGPWQLAADVGLFSDQRMPLPHPPGTVVPQFSVRGMSTGHTGPFKLREFIGFAARGLLPPDALLQGNPNEPWFEAGRLRIIAACLSGDLVLLDNTGRVIKRTAIRTSSTIDQATTHAPIDLVKPTTAASLARPVPAPTVEPPPVEPQSTWTDRTVIASSLEKTGPRFKRLRWFSFLDSWDKASAREWLADHFPVQRVATVVGAALVLGLTAGLFLVWQNRPMDRAEIVGHWIDVGSDMGEPRLVVKFTDNGQCTIVNYYGDCWSGDFEWAERSDTLTGFSHDQDLTLTLDQAETRHAVDVVSALDGHIRLKGLGRDQPLLDEHPVRDLFVRRMDDSLRLGYLVSVHYGAQAKIMQAAWVTLKPLKTPTVTPINLSQFSAPADPPTRLSELVAAHGTPDEARRIYRFEITGDADSSPLVGAQVLRYGKTKFAVTSDGKLTSLAPSSAIR